MSQNQPVRRSADAFDQRSPDQRVSGVELDNIFRLSTSPGERAASDRIAAERLSTQAPSPSVTDARRASQTDLDAALEMLNRAAKAMDVLQARYQQVENYARDVADRAERDLAAAVEQIKACEARALESEAASEQAKTRLEDAERQVEAANRRADQAERSASEARDWLESFCDKVAASFEDRPFSKAAA